MKMNPEGRQEKNVENKKILVFKQKFVVCVPQRKKDVNENAPACFTWPILYMGG